VEAPGLFTFNWDATKASTEEAYYDVPGRSQQERDGRMAHAAGELAALTGKRVLHYYVPGTGMEAGQVPVVDEELFWRDLAQARERQPGALGDMGKDREDFDRRLQTDFQRRAASRAGRMAKGGLLGNLAGGVAGAFTDPLTLLTAGIGGGGRTVLSQILRNGAANAAIEAAETPFVLAERAQQGRDMTLGEAGMNIAAAGVAGGVLDAAGKAAARLPDAAASTFERGVARHWDRLPQGLRDRWTARTSIEPDDALVADMAESIIGPDRMTEDERGAVAIFRREASAAKASPFVPDGAGMAAHRDMQEQVLARIFADGDPAARSLAARPARALAVSGAAPIPARAQTALGSGTVQGDALDAFMARVRRQESSGNDAARPVDPKTGRLLSSAVGRYQFIDGTWLSFYKRRFGRGGLSDAQILAKRTDGRVQDVLMRDLTEYNAAFLRRQSEAVTPGNLYLVHFAGEERAGKLFRADPGMRVEQVLGARAVNANPWMRGWTVRDMLAWSDRKMGGSGVAVRGGAPTVADSVPEFARGQLQSEIDALHAENARIRAELEQGSDTAKITEALDQEPVALDMPQAEVELPPLRRAGEVAAEPSRAPAEVQALLPRLRDMVDDRARQLNDMESLATDLGASEQEVRQAMLELVRTKGGGVAMRRADGAFIRRGPPVARAAPTGPEDVLDFIARNGGIRDDEGNGLGLKGLSRREQSEIISPEAKRRLRDKRATGSRNWQRMTRRNGPLLRHEGQSVDRIGEMLDEAGYLHGAAGGRPTTVEVLDFIEQRIADGKSRFTREDTVAAPELDSGLPDRGEAISVYGEWIADEAERVFGIDRHELDSEFLDYAAGLKHDLGLPEGEAFMRAVNDFADGVRWDAVEEAGGLRYEDVDYDWPFDNSRPGSETLPTEGDLARFEPVGSDEATGDGGGRTAGEGAGAPEPVNLADLPQAEATRFLDPDGTDAKAQADSLLHDARAVLDAGEANDPAIASRQKQEAQLRADAPMRGANRTGQAQDGTMGMALFDAADQPEFRLDVEGEGRTLRDMLDEFDAEAAEIKAARDCQ
jgi:hypothetical protein